MLAKWPPVRQKITRRLPTEQVASSLVMEHGQKTEGVPYPCPFQSRFHAHSTTLDSIPIFQSRARQQAAGSNPILQSCQVCCSPDTRSMHSPAHLHSKYTAQIQIHLQILCSMCIVPLPVHWQLPI
uniref:HDC09753 n=1 Tax=Drosophila melanogaster TaxID=7227 RepID=Q6ILC5_DROME|nr:TPA_inf: HDC09753 [Drosophila melanogaster]